MRMEKVQIIELKETMLADNDQDADVLRSELKAMDTFYLNVMSSPGSGKTTTIVKTIETLASKYKVGVMEADIDSDVDALEILKHGVPAIQLHTGGMCHLDAEMSRQGLRKMQAEQLDLVILENVGNLVCPAEFDTGACKNIVILSVPEGDDKPIKYPLMFERCDAVLINKMDALPAFDFDVEIVKKNIAVRNPDAPVFFLSAKEGTGVQVWCDWLEEQIKNWQKA